jgi:DNA-binding NtrC family response regulator
MREGRFREQLYHRLRECEIFIPSLRDRREDVPLIIDHYIAKHNREMGDLKSVAPGAMDYLQEYNWPGNVRELASVLRVALQTSTADQLEVPDFHRILSRGTSFAPVVVGGGASATRDTPAERPSAEPTVLSEDRSLKDDLAMVDKMKIEKTLERMTGNVSKAAAVLGVSRETLHNKIRKYGIDVQAFRQR